MPTLKLKRRLPKETPWRWREWGLVAVAVKGTGTLRVITYWGPFSILYRPSKATKSGKETSAAWEATCWAAAHTLKQSCKKKMSIDSAKDDAETITSWRVRYWCNLAAHARNKVAHMAHHPSVEDLPDEDSIRRGMLPEGRTGQARAQTSCFFVGT